MSYILDALRKAQTQRERTTAAGPDLGPMALEPRARAGLDLRVGLSLGVLFAAFLVAAWWLGFSDRTGSKPSLAAASAAAPPPLPATPPILPAPTPTPTSLRASAPAKPSNPVALQVAAPHAESGQASAPQAAASPALAALAASAAVRAASLPSFHRMPQDFQQSVPKLLVQGSVAGDTPSQRMVFIGGQVWHEGGEPAPGLVIEQIRARELVLRWRGERFLYAF